MFGSGKTALSVGVHYGVLKRFVYNLDAIFMCYTYIFMRYTVACAYLVYNWCSKVIVFICQLRLEEAIG